MIVRDITPSEREAYNAVVNHPMQSFEWGEFREATGVKILRKGMFEKAKLIEAFQLTIHKIPHTKYTIGYLPKSGLPSKEVIAELRKIGKLYNCVYIQLEPNVSTANHAGEIDNDLIPSFHPLFTKYTFILDLSPSEDDLLKNMHAKTRYNIRVAQKHGVEIVEDNSLEAFEQYWQIMLETTSRQKFYAHTKRYHQLQRDVLLSSNSKAQSAKNNNLSYHLFLAKYKTSANSKGVNLPEQTLAAWVLFTFHDTLYYPYGSSRSVHRETMASNLLMWEAIKFGKKAGLKYFDMWGALSPEPDTNDPWYGFHRFKQGYGPQLIQFVGSYDLVINPMLYKGMQIADKLRWLYLHIKK